MNKFQVKFIVQFIIDVLVLGILLEFVSHVLIATVAKSTSASWTALCYIIVLIEGLFNTLAIIMAVFLLIEERYGSTGQSKQVLCHI